MSENDFRRRIAANVQDVRERIERSALKSGRAGNDVRLIAASKYAAAGDGMVEALFAAGCSELGEARPQYLLEKAEHYTDLPIRWHLIGSLQRNKVRKILPVTALIHSLDSLRLVEAINRIAEEDELPPVHCLLEVALSQDTEKHGVLPEQTLKTLDEMGAHKNIVVDGLMGMAGLESDVPQIHREFELLRTTAESARNRKLPANVPLVELSMGMSDDFEIAIEEGATIVRIGSILYR
ncbi:MAG: YggS family pyridoxal phosphate-dependent enzyme [Planctomycetaceae bacterium]|jgi:pyridoxal phosphate enzyme (YggS family)|nr:YggS family pyridoxal phosphate-dependent enzyme [Planctomycetaceae bacterium]